jgi:imidazolonepropionase-like amidohydrolase
LTQASRYLLQHASVLDADRGELLRDRSVLVVGETIAQVGEGNWSAGEAEVIDVEGMTLMPGLIDAHVHVFAITADLPAMAEWSPSYVTARSIQLLRGMLSRGFTTVRDVAGADYGIAEAVQEGLIDGPRIIFGGKALSPTGGHGDMRNRGRRSSEDMSGSIGLNRVCDGVTDVRVAARDEIRRGAHHIKLMLSGGIASPTDRIDSLQFSVEEIQAAVEEADAANIYVTGHAYTARAVSRGLEAGVRCIEHGNFMDEASIALFKKKDAFYVPTLATYAVLAGQGPAAGLPAASVEKVEGVLEAGLRALELAHRHGLQIVYGTDLLGAMQVQQLSEFELRSQVQSPADIIRSATTVAARLLRLEGKVGTVAVGADADLLVVDGDPTREVSIWKEHERHLKLIMKQGRIYKDSRSR